MLEVLAREHTPRVDVAVIAMSANVVELVTCEDDGSIVTSTDVREDGRHRQTFADVQSAVEAVWCKPPVESHLCLPHVPAVANIPAVAELRQIIEALMDSQTLDAATKAEMCAHLDPLTLQRFVFARPTVDSAASMFTTSMAWRAERNLSALYAELHPTSWESQAASRKARLAAAHFWGGLVGTTKAGYPLFVERLGRIDLEGLSRSPVTREAVVDAYVCYLEGIFRAVRAAASAEGQLVSVHAVHTHMHAPLRGPIPVPSHRLSRRGATDTRTPHQHRILMPHVSRAQHPPRLTAWTCPMHTHASRCGGC